MPNGTNAMASLSDLPGWAKVVGILGAPTVISLWLVYLLSADVRTTTASTNVLIRQHVADQAAWSRRVDDLIQEQARTNRLLTQVCVQGASDAASRRACLDVR